MSFAFLLALRPAFSLPPPGPSYAHSSSDAPRLIQIVQSNADGWAESNIRALYSVLKAEGGDPIISAPINDWSGAGKQRFTQCITRTNTSPASHEFPPAEVPGKGCQYHSCPGFSPPTGANATDDHINYINAPPVTATEYGIKKIGSQLWGGNKPQLVFVGPAVGSNTGWKYFSSATIGSAMYAARHGIPAIAFSGAYSEPTPWTESPLHSDVYAELALTLIGTIIWSGPPYLPGGVWLNVNFPDPYQNGCDSVAKHKWVLTRVDWYHFNDQPHEDWKPFQQPDMEWCGNRTLPSEAWTQYDWGVPACWVTISIGDAAGGGDPNADAVRQRQVAEKLKYMLSCLPAILH